MPDAYPMTLDQLLMQAEQPEQKPEIDDDDRVFLEFAERAFRQTLLSAGRCGCRVCDVLHVSPLPAVRLRPRQDQKPRRPLAHYYNLAKRRKEHPYNGDDAPRPFPSEYVRFWHLADSLSGLAIHPLLGVKRTFRQRSWSKKAPPRWAVPHRQS